MISINRILKPCLALLLVFSFSVNASAATVSELRQRQKDLQSQTEGAKQSLKEAKERKNSLAIEIMDLDVKVSEAQVELARIQADLAESEEKLAKAEAELDDATKAREKQFDSFSKRLKYIHENGSIGYLKVIFGAKSFNDFLKRMQYVNDIMKYDSETLDRLKKTEEIITVKTIEIGEEKNSIELLANEQTEKTQNLESLRQEKKNAAEAAENDEAKYAQKLQELESASQEAERLIAQASISRANSGGGGYVYTGGQLNWPVPGYSNVSSGFVYRKRPIGSGYETHTGLDIPAGYGTNVLAAESGTVIASRYMNGYGYTVMIDHGGGLVTLYGHNSSLVASVGQTVSRGQVIAKVGSTGNSTGNHCHFEVRVNGKATDPSPYVGR